MTRPVAMTDGDWRSGGRGHCLATAVVLLPLLLVLAVLLAPLAAVAGRRDRSGS